MSVEFKPSVQERYIRATQSSNLRDSDRDHNTDILQASAIARGLSTVEINGETFAKVGAMAGGLGSLLLRVKVGNDFGSYPQLLDAWISRVTHSADIFHWPTQIKPRKVAISTLNWWINNICKQCGGTGFQAHENPQLRTNIACNHCDGTGVEELRCAPELRPYVDGAIDDLAKIDRMIGIGINKKLYGERN